MIHGMVELKGALPENRLTNADIAPSGIDARTWSMWNIAALWVAMSVCIPTYMLAASMIEAGMNWWQSMLAILIGNAVVLVPLFVMAHAGTRYGIPFPVLARAAYGITGAHIPSLLRALVACGWFGIQTWIGGLAINVALGILWSGWPDLGGSWAFMGYGASHYLSFFMFWMVNMHFAWAGTESIKWLETIAAPFLVLMGLALLAWAIVRVGGLGTLLAESNRLAGEQSDRTFAQFMLTLFIPWVTAMVGYWATLSLNIPDFTRYARSQKDQMLGQAMGLLTTMPLFAFVGLVVTSATVVVYGEAIWNPIDLVSRITAEGGSQVLGLASMGAIVVATLSTNIAANVVAPANSFSNLDPRRISFRAGGMIAGVIGILIFPWRLLDMYQTWLISYSGLLGAVAGVLVCDYVVIRRGVLLLRDLYTEEGAYTYRRGVNRHAVVATFTGIAVALVGTLHPSLTFLFNGAWFSAAIVAFLVYFLLMRGEATTGDSP